MDGLGLETEIGAWDSVLLEPLSEDTFVANLHQRFKRDQIYTYIGNVLVSVNPYKKLAIYSGDLARAYRSRGPHQLPPHVYAITGAAYRFLRDRNEDQAIVVCGESGSGKTEAARIALQFLAYSPQSVSSSNSSHKTHRISVAPAVRDGLLQAGLVLEAFGNAKTYRNDNSSRFGKYMDIEFDYKGDPLGGTITNYLLEKSRVTYQSQGERNFHIFYQLLTGADIPTLKALKLQRNVDKYVYLRGPTNQPAPPIDAIDDKRDFQLTKHALECLGFCPDQQQQLFRIVAAVLKLGNLGFVPTNNIDGTEGCSIINEYELHEVCQLIGTEMSSFSSSLTQRKLFIQCAPPSPRTRRKDQSATSPSKCSREVCDVCELTCCDMGLLRTGGSDNVTTELSACEASNARDTLCKALYSRLFTWLVNAINESTKVKTYGRRRVLAILDIYGFEILEKNEFDQLLINLCNEKLHQVVLQSTLKGEQEEYLRENIEWCPVEFYDNVNVCELIERCNKGIISLLDEENVRSDEEFLVHLSQASGHRGLLATSTDNNMPANSFRLKHYAGTVTYSVSGFIDKNTEGVPRDVSQALYACEHPLLQALFPEGNPHRSCLKKPASVGSQFRLSLGALIRNLNTKHLHFVRCIKPNELKQPRIFELALVQHQVRYLSLIETVRLRRSGFCHSLTYQQFLCRYKMLSLHTWPKWRGPPVEGVSYLVNDLPIPTGEFAFGRTKIFVRSPRSVFELEEFRRNRLQDLAILVQKIWRGYHQKKQYHKKRNSQIIIASAWRSWRECRFGIPFDGRRHLWCLYRVAREEYRILKHKKQVEWAVNIIQNHYINWKKRAFLNRLACCLPPECESPICRDWPSCPRRLSDTSMLLRRIYHKWRCHKYRLKFDQTSRNRMREKVTASLIFKERKASYPRSVSHPFLGDYVRLRQNVQWKKACIETNDQYVVFADIINKITRSSGKFVPILFVLSTSSMLILDQRTLQIKYRVPATEIYRLSLSPFLDDVAVFHVRAPSPTSDTPSQPIVPGCLFQSELGKKKGDFVFQTGHVIEIVTKLFLVVQNAIGKPPEVNISTEFEANFGQQSVTITFKCLGLPEVPPGQIRILRKANKMEVLV